MTVLRLGLLISLLAFTASAQQISPASTCPVTSPPAKAFIPPSPYELESSERSFLIGNEKLWTGVQRSAVWYTSPRPRGHENEVQPLTAKTFWASVNFNWRTEYPPELKVIGRRLDGDAPPLLTMRPTNAFPGPAAAMLVGVYVPTPGCWEITGEYKGEKLSFVVLVEPSKHRKQ